VGKQPGQEHGLDGECPDRETENVK
jgi:hypothetical protein